MIKADATLGTIREVPRIIFRTDADRIREHGRCQVCGAPRERIEFELALTGLTSVDGVGNICTAEASHLPRFRTRFEGKPVPLVASGRLGS